VEKRLKVEEATVPKGRGKRFCCAGSTPALSAVRDEFSPSPQ